MNTSRQELRIGEKIVLCSPAKLNLVFRVLKKRQDGYHEIASLMQAISLCDVLNISLTQDQDTLTCDDPSLSLDSSNLIIKAIQTFRRNIGRPIPFSFHIHLTKRIPMQSGLGGGSSNAATTLWAINTLLNNVATTQDLISWGKEIGSDVPFFFSTGTAHCFGRGEKCKNISLEKPMKFCVAMPTFGVSTIEVYKNVQCQQQKNTIFDELFLKSNLYDNDLEKAAFAIEPKLKKIKNTLLTMGFKRVCMTGSGAAFFCEGEAKHKGIENIKFFQVDTIQRKSKEWYAF